MRNPANKQTNKQTDGHTKVIAISRFSRDKDDFNDYMKRTKSKNYVSHNKLNCDWTDKKKYLIHYRMLKFYVRHGMKVDKVHEIISFKQSKWLEKNI